MATQSKADKLGAKGYKGTVQDKARAFYTATLAQPSRGLDYWKSLAPSAKGTVQDIKLAAIIASGVSRTNRTLQEMEDIYWKNLA